jgi:hypothetical protein
MHEQYIYADGRNEEQVVAALQQAMNMVLNPEAVGRLSGAGVTQNYQHIFPSIGGPALASVVLAKLAGDDSKWVLTVHVYYGFNRPQILRPIVQRLRVGLKDQPYEVAPVHDRVEQEYTLSLTLPSERFVSSPRGFVKLA